MRRICLYWALLGASLPSLATGAEVSPEELIEVILRATEAQEELSLRKLRDENAKLKAELRITRNKLRLSGKKTEAEKPKPKTVKAQPIYYPRDWRSPHWTWPGDLRTHLIYTHGMKASDVNNASPEQCMRWHDYTHTNPNWRTQTEAERAKAYWILWGEEKKPSVVKKPQKRIKAVRTSTRSSPSCPT